jgi:hypothetical protein
MKLPDDVQYVIKLPPERLTQLRKLKPPLLGARKGVYVCEGYAITPTRFVAIVATCECSGFTTVRLMTMRDWYGFLHETCRVCKDSKQVVFYARKTKGWGYL